MDSESELICVISQMISILESNDSDSVSQPPSNLLSLSSQLISLVSSMDLESESESESELISLIKKLLSVSNSVLESGPESHFVSLVTNMISLIGSIESDPDLMEEPELELRSSFHHAFSLFGTMDSDSELISLLNKIANLVTKEAKKKAKQEAKNKKKAKQEAAMEMEPKLISLLTQLMSIGGDAILYENNFPQFMSLIVQIISLLDSTDLDMLPKPESELMSLITKSISVFESTDYLSYPPHQRQLILSIADIYFSHVNSTDSIVDVNSRFISLVDRALRFKPKPESELISIVHQIFYLVNSLNPKLRKLISLSPQVQVEFEKETFHVTEEAWRSNDLTCRPLNWVKVKLTGEKGATHFRRPLNRRLTREKGATHFCCQGCNGENHKEHEKAPVEVTHLLHPKHPLSLVSLKGEKTRECYCCDEDLNKFFYYCFTCDSAMNVACVEKPPVLYRDHPRWHEHTLALFPRRASLTCNLCALADLSSPIYMCPPCDFVVHLRCINLPRVIRISRHLHRISFTSTFDQGDWFCSVCRRKINNDYGGYSCIKDDCSYTAHSRCATQKNLWDGVELEGKPEEVEEDVAEPFVTISDGIIQHFSHEQHHLRLDEDTSRNYNENNQCQACITPIYFGNFYSCMQCDYILHEKCAKLPRRLHHPIHPHQLTLVGGYGGLMEAIPSCSACPWMCIVGFFYECSKVECHFKVHVQCATISEPLVHESHIHPLYLTSKPGEERICSICEKPRSAYKETFNCIESDFSLCFGCATLPYKVRYKHDKHILTLSYGKESSSLTHWCEVCEGKLNPKKRFYICDEYCCVTLHIKCLIGKDLYMKPDSTWEIEAFSEACVMRNYQHMSRPFCSGCKKRCLYPTVFHYLSSKYYCSTKCILKLF